MVRLVVGRIRLRRRWIWRRRWLRQWQLGRLLKPISLTNEPLQQNHHHPRSPRQPSLGIVNDLTPLPVPHLLISQQFHPPRRHPHPLRPKIPMDRAHSRLPPVLGVHHLHRRRRPRHLPRPLTLLRPLQHVAGPTHQARRRDPRARVLPADPRYHTSQST